MAAWELHEDDEMYEMYSASVFHGPNLQLTKVNRKHMSEYVCVASNGIPPDESWTIKLLVTCESSEYAQNLTQFVALYPWGHTHKTRGIPVGFSSSSCGGQGADDPNTRRGDGQTRLHGGIVAQTGDSLGKRGEADIRQR